MDNRHICGPSLTETSLCGAYLSMVKMIDWNTTSKKICNLILLLSQNWQRQETFSLTSKTDVTPDITY